MYFKSYFCCINEARIEIGLVVVARKGVRHDLAAVVILNCTRTVNAGVVLLELDYSI